MLTRLLLIASLLFTLVRCGQDLDPSELTSISRMPEKSFDVRKDVFEKVVFDWLNYEIDLDDKHTLSVITAGPDQYCVVLHTWSEKKYKETFVTKEGALSADQVRGTLAYSPYFSKARLLPLTIGIFLPIASVFTGKSYKYKFGETLTGLQTLLRSGKADQFWGSFTKPFQEPVENLVEIRNKIVAMIKGQDKDKEGFAGALRLYWGDERVAAGRKIIVGGAGMVGLPLAGWEIVKGPVVDESRDAIALAAGSWLLPIPGAPFIAEEIIRQNRFHSLISDQENLLTTDTNFYKFIYNLYTTKPAYPGACDKSRLSEETRPEYLRDE